MDGILKHYLPSPLEYGQPDLLPHRALQAPPDYTSPPLADALAATPEAYRSDEVIDEARMMAAAGNCTVEEGQRCHIPFVPDVQQWETSKVGVIFYCGGLVDPRGYSPLAAKLTDDYGLPVVMPIFNADIAFTFGVCDSGRIDLAQAEFPEVESWIMAGHSFGGVGATVDAWSRFSNDSNDENSIIGGLVLLAADVQEGLGCGNIDFSTSTLPMAAVTASEDLILNNTRWELNRRFLSPETQILNIYGGNHGQFGSYNDTERTPILGQVDGEPKIPPHAQHDLVAASFYHVATRVGLELPSRLESTSSPTLAPTDAPDNSSSAAQNSSSREWGTAILVSIFLIAQAF